MVLKGSIGGEELSLALKGPKEDLDGLIRKQANILERKS